MAFGIKPRPDDKPVDSDKAKEFQKSVHQHWTWLILGIAPAEQTEEKIREKGKHRPAQLADSISPLLFPGIEKPAEYIAARHGLSGAMDGLGFHISHQPSSVLDSIRSVKGYAAQLKTAIDAKKATLEGDARALVDQHSQALEKLVATAKELAGDGRAAEIGKAM